MHRKTVLGAVLAASLLGLGTAAQAQQLVVEIAPPAPRYEVMPDPRPGYVWDAGHYEWRGNQYVWVPGRWIAARSGYDWQERRWVQRGNGEWVLVGGTWEERRAMREERHAMREERRVERYARRFGPNGDYDRDGIANQYDRDIDGDGIRNRRDAFPYDHRRS